MVRLETMTAIWTSVWDFSPSFVLFLSFSSFFPIFSLCTDYTLLFSKSLCILSFFSVSSCFSVLKFSVHVSQFPGSFCSGHPRNSWFLLLLNSKIKIIFCNRFFFCVYWLFLYVPLVYITHQSWLFYTPNLITKPLHSTLPAWACCFFVSSCSSFICDVILF